MIPGPCRGSNVELAEAAGHFDISIPKSAEDLRFLSNVHPLYGEYTLNARFSMPRDELSNFLHQSKFPQLSRMTDAIGGGPPCPKEPKPDRRIMRSERRVGSVQLSVLDRANDRVTVFIQALDL